LSTKNSIPGKQEIYEKRAAIFDLFAHSKPVPERCSHKVGALGGELYLHLFRYTRNAITKKSFRRKKAGLDISWLPKYLSFQQAPDNKKLKKQQVFIVIPLYLPASINESNS